MKAKHLFLSFCTISMFVVGCTNDFDVIESDSSISSTQQTRTVIDSPDVTFQMKANIAYNNMLNAFNGKTSRSSNGEQTYPDYYGGAYINDKGQLVVNVYGKEKNSTVENSLKEIAKDENIITVQCDYSYNYLKSLMTTIRTYKKQNPNSPLTKGFRVTALKEIENRIYVFLSDESLFQDFKSEISDSPAICLFKADYSEKQAANNLNPGSGIYFQDSEGTHTGSMGYRAKRNGVTGVVTAGHVARTKGIALYASFDGVSKYFGTSEYSVLSGAVDACFIKTYDNFEGTNVVGDEELYTVAMTPAVNTIVNLRSYVGHKWGPIKDLDVDVDYRDGDSFEGLMDILYNEPTIGGESGGIVYAVDSSTGLRFTVGLHEGHSKETGYSHTTKAVEANKKLNLVQY
jgi:hypothetical protein